MLRIFVGACVLLALAVAPASAQPLARVALHGPDAAVAVGVLSQPTVDWEAVGQPDGSGSVYMRRLRLIANGTFGKKLTVFAESDTPNLGRMAGGTRQRTTFLQDLIVTYAVRDALRLDAGLLMVPVSYNSLQSAASLLAIGYGPYSFVSSAPTTSRVGRDQGVQARGYLAGRHLEYRVAGFRGIRQIDPGAPVRVAGRVVWYPFEAQTGFFYTGTTHGRKRLLGLGASLDVQGGYSARAVDLFYEAPTRGRDAVTFQADVIRYDGGATLRQIPRQNTVLLESGYLWGRWHAGVYGQGNWQKMADGLDSASWQAGAVWWAIGHRANVKGGVGRTSREHATPKTEIVVQTQLFVF